MAKKTVAPAVQVADSKSGASGEARVAPPIGQVIPHHGGATVLEFFLADGHLQAAAHAVIGWWVAGDQVEPLTVAPANPHGLRCVVESFGSEMSYTFLEPAHTRVATVTAAGDYARSVIGG